MKKKIKIDPSKYETEKEYDGTEFDLYTTKYDGKFYEFLRARNERIILLPFDINEFNQVKRIYITKFFDFGNNTTQFKPIIHQVDEDEDTSLIDTVKRAALHNLGLVSAQLDIDSLMYLGTIEVNDGLSETIRCYAVDVTQFAKSPRGFKPDEELLPETKTIEPILFADVIRGEYRDSLTLALSMLFLSNMDQN